ncbi:hypothetical protein KY290_036128 [Solanum tuberosum]|uniref:Uncharacterized protein n=1 Tax=Solanum tuberosum TaxID=4113 RepID=A0ABQ7TTC3_SOLTU|nr:hypothetical protein KY290_036128 [Solanum tuberosum]
MIMGTSANQQKNLASRRVVGNKQSKHEWMVRERNKYGHIEGEIDYQDKNTFEALREEEEHEQVDDKSINVVEGSTKEWVNRNLAVSNKNQKIRKGKNLGRKENQVNKRRRIIHKGKKRFQVRKERKTKHMKAARQCHHNVKKVRKLESSRMKKLRMGKVMKRCMREQ